MHKADVQNQIEHKPFPAVSLFFFFYLFPVFKTVCAPLFVFIWVRRKLKDIEEYEWKNRQEMGRTAEKIEHCWWHSMPFSKLYRRTNAFDLCTLETLSRKKFNNASSFINYFDEAQFFSSLLWVSTFPTKKNCSLFNSWWKWVWKVCHYFSWRRHSSGSNDI